MVEEVVRLLNPQPAQIFVDGTVGGGGHARRIGERLVPGGTLVAIDRDREALAAAREVLDPLPLTVRYIHGNFRDLPALLEEAGIRTVHGIVLDLGVSSHQLDTPGRGFSFREDAPLDMRMDTTRGETAADLLARLDEPSLSRILLEYGEERWAARIARFILERRESEPIVTTGQLADLVRRAIPKGAHPRNIHVATRTFQALRLAVNGELEALQQALEGGVVRLAIGGRIAVLSYHSLEDRIVKQMFAWLGGKCRCPPGLPICRCGAKKSVRIVTRKPILPNEAEIAQNPRARSAKLRVVERIRV
jgi:16S rRNA (cytosine1402-N4)-methyltransferase